MKTLSLFALLLSTACAENEVQIRMRVTRLKPAQPSRILWRWGGEGLGGMPTRGELTQYLPEKPAAPDVVGEEAAEDLDTDELVIDEKPKDRLTIQDDTWRYDYLNPGTWSTAHPLSVFKRKNRRLILTVTLTGHDTATQITDSELEVELLLGKKSLKRFNVSGSDGPTFGLVLPLHALKDGKPTDEFIQQSGSLYDYAMVKLETLRKASWAKAPVPKQYSIVTDCSGYKAGAGYGCRTADRATMLAEFQVLRMMGINGTVNCPPFVLDMIRNGEGLGKELRNARLIHTTGYPINSVKYADGTAPIREPGDGCPYHPINIEGIPKRVEDAVQTILETGRPSGVREIWALTQDEIGTVFDWAPERKSHMGCCPYCREGFRNLVKSEGRTLADFGAPEWTDIRATYGYWAISFWETKQKLEKAVADARAAVGAETEGAFQTKIADLKTTQDDAALDDLDTEIEGKPKDHATELIDAQARLKTLIWSSSVLEVPEAERKVRLSPEGWSLLSYYSRRFNAESAARLFEPLKDRIELENNRKRDAIAAGEDSTVARQPWIYSYALRGNTFLMGGHSLGFFDFYQYADNGFMYETSNRDYRVWQWDSYLCDVGRSLSRYRNKRFGIYVKPHRGAPVQRALTAVARGVRLLYWYTYGPDWAKGDTFGGRLDILEKVGHVARIMARAEDVTYDSVWAFPAEVAIVRPRTAEFASGSASWENGKWIYTALMNSHIPVAPLDEGLLLSEDLSKFKVIVVCGDHIRKDVALRIRDWVSLGGTLYTTGRGMAADESNLPLEILHPMLGLQERVKTETWANVPRYGSTSLRPISPTGEPPRGTEIQPTRELECNFVPTVGRETVIAAPGARTVLKYEDGSPALIRNSFGKGVAWYATFYAGLEYAYEIMQKAEFDETKRALIAHPILTSGVEPVVDASVPMVEGVLLENSKDGRQAVVLMNWKFNVEKPLTVSVRGAQKFTTAYSCANDTTYRIADGVIQLPRLGEGDILLLRE